MGNLNLVTSSGGSINVAPALTSGTFTLTAPAKNDTLATLGDVGSFRNRFTNGALAIDQRNAGAAQTIVAGGALAYTVDRWSAFATGANVTGQRISPTPGFYRYQFTGAASNATINFGQRIEAINSFDMAGATTSFSVDLANSLLTSVAWTAYYANTTDTFGTVAAPTKTAFASGVFTVTSTVTRYNAQIVAPPAANTGIEIVLTVSSQTSGTWTIGNLQFEKASAPSAFDYRPTASEILLCRRYTRPIPVGAQMIANATTGGNIPLVFESQMRAAPTVAAGSGSITVTYSSTFSTTSAPTIGTASVDGALLTLAGFTGLTAGIPYVISALPATNHFLTAEL